MVTLSLVMTGWGSKSATCSFRLTFFTTRSMNGSLKCIPTPQTLWNAIPPERPRSLAAYITTVARRLALDKCDYNRAAQRRSDLTVAFEELEGCLPAEDGAVRALEPVSYTHLEVYKRQAMYWITILRRLFLSGATAPSWARPWRCCWTTPSNTPHPVRPSA